MTYVVGPARRSVLPILVAARLLAKADTIVFFFPLNVWYNFLLLIIATATNAKDCEFLFNKQLFTQAHVQNDCLY